MPTNSIKHQVDKGRTVEGYAGYKGTSFQAFSKAESVPFVVKITSEAAVDFSGYQVFVSYTDISAESCGVLTEEQFAESKLTYDGTDTEDPTKYIFSGVITDEQTILLPEGIGAVIGAIKIIDPAGNSTFADKAKITVFPCDNPRTDRS